VLFSYALREQRQASSVLICYVGPGLAPAWPSRPVMAGEEAALHPNWDTARQAQLLMDGEKVEKR
jgi:hypothetical protein